MMLQLVQSPSQRVQRLIKTKCSSDGETARSIVSTSDTDNTDKGKPLHGSQQDQQAEHDTDDEGSVESSPKAVRASESSSLTGSSSTTGEDERPFAMNVDELLDRDGNLIAASVSSYSTRN